MHNIKQIIRKIKHHDVISFDIFDTLLLRPIMQPSDLFTIIGQITNNPDFVSRRQNAEHDFYAAHGHDTDATLDDIYSMIPEFSSEKELELNLEYAGLVANPEIMHLYNAARRQNKKIIVVSDMYLPIEFIKRVLDKNNIIGYDKLYLSNDVGHRKDRGDMYDFILGDLNIAPDKILHIGDNKQSDYTQARRHKIHAWNYTPQTTKFIHNNQQFQKFYSDATNAVDASIITAMAAQYTDTGNYWVDFGYKYAGPIAFAYAVYIYDKCIRENINNVLFVARDGYLIQKVFNIINLQQIKTRYVYAPRVLNYTANLDFDYNRVEQPRIVCEYFNINVGDNTYGDYIQKNLSVFKKLACAEKTKTGYRPYISNLIGKNKKIGVVDTISGQLSSQKLIESESGVKTVGFYVMTIPGSDILDKMSHYDFFTASLRNLALSGHKQDFIELIFSAPENPIITMRDGVPVYQNVSNPYEHMRHEIYKQIESGALAFASNMFKRWNKNIIQITPKTIFKLINAYVSHPQRADIVAMFNAWRSPYADNKMYVPIFAAPYHWWRIKETKQLVWTTRMQRAAIVMACPIKIKMHGIKSLKILLFPKLHKSIINMSILGRYGIWIGEYDEN